jgi:hypothetical protein
MRYIVVDGSVIMGVTESGTPINEPEYKIITSTVLAETLLDEYYWDETKGLMHKGERPGTYYDWDSLSLSWVYSIFKHRTDVASRITYQCKAVIGGGYKSDALGHDHSYPSKGTDQINMVASCTDSLNPDNSPDWTTPFWCANAANEWAFREHTAVQIRKAGRDGKAAIVNYQLKNQRLLDQVALATTAEELEAIAW